MPSGGRRPRTPDRDLVGDGQAKALETDHPLGVAGQHPDRGQPQVLEDLRPDAVAAKRDLVTVRWPLARLVVSGVAGQLCQHALPARRRVEIDEDPAALPLDHLECELELLATAAELRVEDVTGQAADVDPDQHVLGPRNLTL